MRAGAISGCAARYSNRDVVPALWTPAMITVVGRPGTRSASRPDFLAIVTMRFPRGRKRAAASPVRGSSVGQANSMPEASTILFAKQLHGATRMSRILCVCLRHHSRQAFDELRRRIATGAARLQPRNSTVRPLRLVASGRIVTGIFHPSATNLVRGTSVCIGCTVASRQWDEPGTPRPEGTYAICRSDGRTLEILSDAVGSRTLWYYMDDWIFIASSSQRWIACVLGTFVPNAAAMTWMLVTGCLGPVHAWDSRVRRLPPDCTLTFDPDRWTARLSVSESLFEAAREKAARRKERLRQLLCETFEELHLDRSKWVLALSGGYDSRGLLCLARQPAALRTITWGTRRSLANPASDSAVASSLATAVGASHEYFETDLVAGSLASVLEAFIAIGEGRIDHLSGYLDGFAPWRRLAGRGIEGVIRGDEGFGWN